MSPKLSVSLIAASFVGLTMTAFGQEKERPTKISDWQGVWKMTSSRLGRDMAIGNEAYLLVRGDRASIQEKTGAIEGGLYIGTSGSLKTFDLATSMRTMRGIYSLDGDTLTICYSLPRSGDPSDPSKRPQRLAADPSGDNALITFRRESRDAFWQRPDGSIAFPQMIRSDK